MIIHRPNPGPPPVQRPPVSNFDTIAATFYPIYVVVGCLAMLVTNRIWLLEANKPGAGLGGILVLGLIIASLSWAPPAVVSAFMLTPRMLRGESKAFMTAGLVLLLPVVLGFPFIAILCGNLFAVGLGGLEPTQAKALGSFVSLFTVVTFIYGVSYSDALRATYPARPSRAFADSGPGYKRTAGGGLLRGGCTTIHQVSCIELFHYTLGVSRASHQWQPNVYFAAHQGTNAPE